MSRARFDMSARGPTTVDYKQYLKAWFVLSVAVFGVFYGVAAGQWGWFPKPQLQRAWNQAEATLTDNPYSFLEPQV